MLAGGAQVTGSLIEGFFMRRYFAFILLLLILGTVMAAEPDTPSAPNPMIGIIGWELVGQEFDISTGETVGVPVLVKKTKTLAQCSIAQEGRISRPHNVGVRWFATVYSCRHAMTAWKGAEQL